MLDIIPIVLLTIVLVILLRKPKRINSSIQEIRDQVHSLHQKTSRYEQEIIGVRREVRNRLGALDTQLGALDTRLRTLNIRIGASEAQIITLINTLMASSEPSDYTETWWRTLSNDVYETFIKSSECFDYEAVWWKALSAWYREQKNWKCEACHLSLHKHTGYLHAHHIWGTRLSTPEDLMALCIGCHAEQPGHSHLKEESDYEGFMERYGKKWRELNHIDG